MIMTPSNLISKSNFSHCKRNGIIRDILQNHLLQVLTLLCCEPPTVAQGPHAANAIRDAKVHVLNCIPPIELEDCVLGTSAND